MYETGPLAELMRRLRDVNATEAWCMAVAASTHGGDGGGGDGDVGASGGWGGTPGGAKGGERGDGCIGGDTVANGGGGATPCTSGAALMAVTAPV